MINSIKTFVGNSIILKLIPWPLSKGTLIRSGKCIGTRITVFNMNLFTFIEPRFNRYTGA